MAWKLPDDLVRLVRERRVIPFVGAGFSACVGLPGWDLLLKDVAADLGISESEPKMSFKELTELANGDFLRIAEYLYIRSGGNIGPLRHAVTNALRTDRSPADSLGHVELLNVGAPQVYTTNFDDLIERTFRELHQPAEVVALPRDVAVADSTQTQIVKYHGDLRFDETLVLTESQYWTRLDFESPMDLKFRSDLLGRSVLFMGYSFSDINIRVIWFKLMQMMRDVPKKDRLPSYIVRLGPNPVLEALFEEVGLKAIVLDPRDEIKGEDDRRRLLGEFLVDLASSATADNSVPGADVRLFASKELLDDVRADWSAQLGGSSRLSHLLRRQVPQPLRSEANAVLEMLAETESFEFLRAAPATLSWAHEMLGVSAAATHIAVTTLLQARPLLANSEVEWAMVWEADISDDLARRILRETVRELSGHEEEHWFDDDVAFLLDLVVRLAEGLTQNEELQQEARHLITRASKLFPVIASYQPNDQGRPDPGVIVKEIEGRREAVAADRESTDGE